MKMVSDGWLMSQRKKKPYTIFGTLNYTGMKHYSRMT